MRVDELLLHGLCKCFTFALSVSLIMSSVMSVATSLCYYSCQNVCFQVTVQLPDFSEQTNVSSAASKPFLIRHAYSVLSECCYCPCREDSVTNVTNHAATQPTNQPPTINHLLTCWKHSVIDIPYFRATYLLNYKCHRYLFCTSKNYSNC